MTTGPLDLILSPRDPIIVRSGSPFTPDPGAQATTLQWPLPGTVTGAIRAHIGKSGQVDRADLKKITVHGALLIERPLGADIWRACLPAPLDAAIFRNSQGVQVRKLRPHAFAPGEGSNLPVLEHHKVFPILIEHEEKPERGFDFWSLDDTVRWLDDRNSTAIPEEYRGHLPQDVSTHVAIERDSGTAKTGHLFATTSLAFSPASSSLWPEHPETALLCRVTLSDGMHWTPTESFLTLGAEARSVRLNMETLPEHLPAPWAAPEALLDALEGQTTLRLQLVTPAIFRTGWYPGWLTQTHRDRNPPALQGMKITLKSAIVGRRVPVSGWSMNQQREKPLRYAAPSGSVYFLSLEKPLTRDQVRALWMAPISDTTFDREDGYGLAVPGVWNNDIKE